MNQSLASANCRTSGALQSYSHSTGAAATAPTASPPIVAHSASGGQSQRSAARGRTVEHQPRTYGDFASSDDQETSTSRSVDSVVVARLLRTTNGINDLRF